MKAIILAAGEGSRARPYTLDRPKCLLELGGKALLDWQIDTFNCCGIEDIVVVIGHKGDQIDRPGIRTYVNPRYSETNMIYSLWCAEPELQNEVVVSYADIVYEPAVLQALLAEPHDLAIVVDRQWEKYWRMRFEDPLEDAETLGLDDKGRILDIGRAATSLDEIQAQYIGLMKFKGQGLLRMKAFYASAANQPAANGNPWGVARTLEKAYMTDLLRALIHAGFHLQAVPIESGWLEIDTRHDYDLVLSRLAANSLHELFDPRELNCWGNSERVALLP